MNRFAIEADQSYVGETVTCATAMSDIEQNPLSRVLGRTDAAWLVAGNMIGAGIFITPGLIAERLQGGWSLVAWLVGGLFALAGAAVYGELGARIPKAGGDYQYLRRAYGPLWGFLAGWSAITMSFSAAAAAMARVSVDNLATAAGMTLPPSAYFIAAPVMILLLVAANTKGARVAGWTTLVLTAIPVGVVLVAAITASLGGKASADAASFTGTSIPNISLFGAALVPVYFTYSGWNAAAYMAGEMRDARRDLGRALLIGTGFVAAFYIVFNAALLAAVPRDLLAGSTTATTVAAAKMAGATGERILALVISLAVMGSANVTLMAGARIYFAMGLDGLAPRVFARTNSRGVPAGALWISGLWTSLLAMVGSVGVLVSWATLAILLLSSLAVSSLIVLRRRDPASVGFHCPGYPLTPVLYILVSLGVAVSTLFYDPRHAIIGLAIIASGVPMYFLARHS